MIDQADKLAELAALLRTLSPADRAKLAALLTSGDHENITIAEARHK